MRGKTEHGEWVVDKDLTAERVVLSLLRKPRGHEARLTLEEASTLGASLIATARSMKQRLDSTGE